MATRWMRCGGSGARKVVVGAAIGTVILVAGVPAAGAQEADPDPATNAVSECSLGVTVSGGVSEDLTGFVTGEPIDLELSYVSDAPVLTYFVLEAPDGGEDVRLNDGTEATMTLTPEVAGTYTVHGEFEDVATGEPVEVATPETCAATVEVVDATVDPPGDPGACADDDDLTLVPIGDDVFEVYDDEGNLCAVIAGETVTRPAPAEPAELPATGSSAAPLTAVGVALISLGWGARRAGARAERR
jgi:LPXTG-motif cell wall-anchored protein